MKRLSVTTLLVASAACATPRATLPAPSQPLVATGLQALPPLPPAGEARPFAVPDVHASRLSNGMHVYVLPQHAWPFVQVTFASRRAGEDGELHSAGLPSLLGRVMSASPDDREEPLQAPTGSPGAGAGADGGGGGSAGQGGKDDGVDDTLFRNSATSRHRTSISYQVEKKHTKRAVRSLAELVQHPNFEEDRFKEARAGAAKSAGAWWGMSGMAHNFLMQRLYGPNHLLGQHADTAEKRIEDHTLEAVKTAHTRRFSPEAGALIVVGDVEPDAVQTWAETYFAKWQPTGKKAKRYQRPKWQTRGKRFLFLHAGDVDQAQITIGQKVPGRLSEDYAALLVLTELLGGRGRLDSRLNRALREEDGVTYGARAGYVPRIDGGTLILSTATQRDAAEASARRMLAEMKRLQTEPVSPGELANTKAAIRERLAASLETGPDAANRLASLFEVGLLPQRLADYARAVEAITPRQLQEVAMRVLNPGGASIVVVGDLDRSFKLGRWADAEDETY